MMKYKFRNQHHTQALFGILFVWSIITFIVYPNVLTIAMPMFLSIFLLSTLLGNLGLITDIYEPNK